MQFSVIIPARNEAKSIAAAVMSALNQAGTTVEVIVVDDGSTDATGDIVHRIGENDDRITLLRNPISAGVSAARNRALNAARGEWIAILDADDEFLPGRLSRIVREAERRTLNMFADNLTLRSEAGEDLGVAFAETGLQRLAPVTLDMFLLHDIPHMQPLGIGYCKPIIRRDFLITHGVRFREGISCAEDFLFYVECLIAGAQLGFSVATGYVYTVRPNGHGTAFNLQASEVNRLISRLAKNVRPSPLHVLRRRQRAIDLDALQKSLWARQYREVMTSLRRLPPWLVIRYVATVVVRRTRRLAAV